MAVQEPRYKFDKEAYKSEINEYFGQCISMFNQQKQTVWPLSTSTIGKGIERNGGILQGLPGMIPGMSGIARTSRPVTDISKQEEICYYDLDMSEQCQRYEETLKRLRETGNCNEADLGSLLLKTNELLKGAAVHIIGFMISVVGADSREEVNRVYKRERDFIWDVAVDTLVTTRFLDKIVGFNGQSYAALCKNCIGELYLIAVVATFFMSAEEMLAKSMDNADELKEKYEKKKKELRTIKDGLRKEGTMAKKADDLQASLDKLKSDYDALHREYLRLGKRMKALENENEKLREAAQKASVNEADVQTSVDTLDTVDVAPVASEWADDGFVAPVLPEDSTVVVLGGHQNLTKKLKAEHPNWEFISPDSDGGRSGATYAKRNVSALIILYKHISHTLYNNIKQNVDSRVPVIYIQSVNISAIEDEIEEQWENHWRKESKKLNRADETK